MSVRSDGALIAHLRRHGVPHVVIGGWAVIAHGYVRATEDIDVLIPDTPQMRRAATAALHEVNARSLDGRALAEDDDMPDQGWQVDTDHGRIDVLLEGVAPLDYASVAQTAVTGELDGETAMIADLAHLAAFKRLAGRARDRADLEELEALHGELPVLAVPGLDGGRPLAEPSDDG